MNSLCVIVNSKLKTFYLDLSSNEMGNIIGKKFFKFI